MKIISLWIFLFSFWPMILSAAPMERKDLPENLGSWVPWVLHGQEHLVNCPPLHNRKDQWECSWPSRLELTLNEKGGAFVQDWKLFDEGWLVLPGNIKHWPQQVKVNGNSAQVVDHQGLPAIFTEVGDYKIEGSFAWETLPEFMQITPQTALVSLSVNQRTTTIPDIDANGRVWLGERDQIGSDRLKDQESRLTIRVFRKITDDVPVKMTLHVELDVSGKPREVLLGQGLPKGTTPMSLESSLPARIEPDGRLFVQVRPGSWTLVLTSRYPGPVQEISLDAGESPWPEEEVWVFEAKNHLRLVEIQGATPIDPQQTAMPENWRNLPAYRLVPGETLSFTEKRRGDPDPAPDRLTLQRNIWLDFEGNGYTIQDQIQGTMTRGWRLEMGPPAQLGQVMVDGKGQFITRLDESGKTGVEVRQGQIQMSADSRIDGKISPLPVVGWEHDFQQVSAVLNLPPGWRLLNAKGVDDVPGTWLKRWSLLDLFLVLIISLSIAKLWGFQWGILSLAALALVYHEPHAPRFVWLNILFAVALLRVLPLGRFKRFVTMYRNISLLSLVIISLPFMVDQVREGIFPQMERPWQVVAPAKAPMRQGMVEEDKLAEMEMRPETQALKSEMYRSRDKWSSVGKRRLQTLQYDPKANIQTGPGLPVWRWRAIPLKWNGPVEQTQTMTLYLLSPKMNMFLAFLRVLLLAGLVFCVLDLRYRKGEGFHLPFSKGGATALLIIGMAFSLILPLTARAEYPSPEILKELRLRLLEKPDCFPLCADSPRMELEVNEKILRARMEVHSLALTAIPLPGSQDEWLPHLILINDLPAKALFKSKEGQIWIEVPKGIHQILMEGPLPNRASVQIPLPLKPHRVNAKLQGWSLDGIHENGLPDNNLQLTRVMVKSEEKEEQILETGTLPPFVHVERTLHLGLDWEIHTQLKRLTPPGSAVVVEVPLLEGESVTSEHIRIVDSKALINMSPNDQVMEWTSVFKKQETITLTAPETTSWSEVWKLDVSPIWHVTLSGIPVVHHQDQNRWLPSFRPWPGESVTIAVFRPQGVEGRTLTVDETKLTVAPGLRATDTTMSLKMRSSQGGQHTLEIPANANLQSISIDGVPQSIRQEENRVTLPLVPGTQNVVLQFQQSAGMGTSYRTPLIDLGLESVNAMIQMKVPKNRWVLWATGPDLGPAVLFWGVVLVILFLSFGLGRVQMTPLRSRHWLLLGLGLSAAALPAVIFVAAWFFAMGKRRTLSEDTDRKTFNTVQVGLGILTLIALASMIGAIQQGLLGYPDMQIAGNGSSSFLLRWYMDKAGEILPRAGIFTVPMMVYRILMLAWALWLAFALLRWARWAWECYSTHGIWRSGKIIKPEKTYNPSHTVVTPEDQH